MPEAIRLAKRVVELKACSRREAELYILGGWVRVDGAVIVAPQFLVANQQVTIDPDADLNPVELVTLLASQNPGDSLIEPSTRIHGATRASSFSNMRVNSRHFVRLFEILPLEPDIAGLAVYTQDRLLVARLQHLEQEFVVETAGTIHENGLSLLQNGTQVDDQVLAPEQVSPNRRHDIEVSPNRRHDIEVSPNRRQDIKVSWQNEVRLRFALKDPAPGQLRAMCAQVGLSVLTIKRIRIGRISLGKMAAGEWRYLEPRERF
jgi:23S rRNA pseudouridine2604 synthase